jgi:hypothetical protein
MNVTYLRSRMNIHSLREHLALEMIEEERLKKGSIFADTMMKKTRYHLSKTAVLSQDRPDTRDLVGHLLTCDYQ